MVQRGTGATALPLCIHSTQVHIRYVMPPLLPFNASLQPRPNMRYMACSPNQRRAQGMWPSNPPFTGEPKVHGPLLLSFSVATSFGILRNLSKAGSNNLSTASGNKFSYPEPSIASSKKFHSKPVPKQSLHSRVGSRQQAAPAAAQAKGSGTRSRDPAARSKQNKRSLKTQGPKPYTPIQLL